ncbi:hypothetical protein DSCO28_21360 [Desulfosarcina ovata subsp. sediminis]|uniref:Uncharacterized protein n=1 Tax=Desulfosarcina ovata subsp. sediminis TaxID=885957 RepID=A0A5K7ZQ76_9BACT|nr:hypothetical protein [Desulfosarcina ovata]BBO81570.1 hypothetical protein DSCO28_21360 [Desulfosarcina ovata subsp. sediminis]
MQDEFIQIFNLLVVLVPISSVILCRKYFPNNFWVGIFLSIVAFPIGHFYMGKGLSYVVIIVLFVCLASIITHNEVVLVIAGCLVSLIAVN